MTAGMRVLETADTSKKIRDHAFEEVRQLPDTVTSGDACVSLDAPQQCKPRPAPSRKTEERERVA
jgi:hypothetical protein